MITDKIKALFNFIDFLDKNKSVYIAKYIPITNEALELAKQRSALSPETNYKDKRQYDLIQKEIEYKFDHVYKNVTLPILGELKSQGIWEGDKVYTSIYNNTIGAIQYLKEDFADNDIEEVIKYKQKYLSFRTDTSSYFLSLEFVFHELDEGLKVLFDFFKDTNKNEFEGIETKTVQANDIREAAELFAKGYTKISLPNTFLNSTAVQPLPKNIPNVDTRFWLTTFFDEHEQNTQQYKNFQFKIKNDGYIDIITDKGTVKIYTPELALIFTLKELPARNMDTDKEIKLSGLEYLKTYIEGYKEGEQYFEKEFKVSPDTLYGANAEQYVRDIHLNFFHVQHTGINEGWGYVKKQYPFILTRKAVREFGYYSGIVNKVEEQIKKYPKQFATFDKCEHNLPPHQTKTYAAKFYALYHWLKIEMGTEMQFAKNDNDQFVKSKIEAYAKSKYTDCSAQGFYRSFKELDITNRTAIANSFGNGYKETLIAISNNDNKLITHLKNYPN